MRADAAAHRAQRRTGFTVIELLVASAVIAVVLGATTALLARSYQAYRLNQELSERQQEIEAAVKILSYDVALAGYRGTGAADMTRTFAAPTIQVFTGGAAAAGSDRLVVRYYEDTDRLFDGGDSCGSPCVVTYDVDDQDGDVLLFREEGTAGVRGIVQQVQSFRVLQYIARGGQTCTFGDVEPGCPPFPEDLAALNVEIRFRDGAVWRFPIGITNPQNP